jgi:hypothetical protein
MSSDIFEEYSIDGYNKIAQTDKNLKMFYEHIDKAISHTIALFKEYHNSTNNLHEFSNLMIDIILLQQDHPKDKTKNFQQFLKDKYSITSTIKTPFKHHLCGYLKIIENYLTEHNTLKVIYLGLFDKTNIGKILSEKDSFTLKNEDCNNDKLYSQLIYCYANQTNMETLLYDINYENEQESKLNNSEHFVPNVYSQIFEIFERQAIETLYNNYSIDTLPRLDNV